MPRVRFSISYEIDSEKKASYLEHLKNLKAHLEASGRAQYSVFETKGKENSYTEVFETASIEDYDNLEDGQDERTEELIRNIESCKIKGSTHYSTQIEVIDEG